MAVFNIGAEFGWVVIGAILLYLQQAMILVIPVVMQRKKTGILAPTLYPRDSEIAKLKLTEEQVGKYMRTQRAHQNNVEFTSVFMAVYILAGLINPMSTFYAGLVVLLGRQITAFGYIASATGKGRSIGGFFHIGEYWILYILGRFAYECITAPGTQWPFAGFF